MNGVVVLHRPRHRGAELSEDPEDRREVERAQPLAVAVAPGGAPPAQQAAQVVVDVVIRAVLVVAAREERQDVAVSPEEIQEPVPVIVIMSPDNPVFGYRVFVVVEGTESVDGMVSISGSLVSAVLAVPEAGFAETATTEFSRGQGIHYDVMRVRRVFRVMICQRPAEEPC